jgi:hypothetical protein
LTASSRSAGFSRLGRRPYPPATIILQSAVQLQIEDVIRYKLLVISSLSNIFRIRPLHLSGDAGGAEESLGTDAKNLLTNNK